MHRTLVLYLALFAAVGTVFFLGFWSGAGRVIETVKIGSAAPSQGLKQWATSRNWDEIRRGLNETGINKPFGHTFRVRNCTDQAKLTVDVKPTPEELVGNDTMGITFADAEGNQVPGTEEWVAWLGDVPDPRGLPKLLSKPWTSANYPVGFTHELKLASLPGGKNLIASINKAGFFDFYVQDDTIVESLDLTGCD